MSEIGKRSSEMESVILLIDGHCDNEHSQKFFHPIAGTAMDEIFTRYMYERAKQGIKSSTKTRK